MSRKRILFVDDDANVLAGMQNLMRRQRHRWDMVFAPGGAAALAEMEKGPVDVIVSDMRMPLMDGATLLRAVRDRYPGVARIVLSGHAEPDAVLRALPVAHQYLNKPCDSETLVTVIERSCNLQELLLDQQVRQAVGRLEKLPSPPRTFCELQEAVARPGASVGDIARIVERDPGMAAKILQLVNSAYFGLPRRVSAIAEAVTYLGVETVKALALSAHVFAAVEPSHVEGFSLDRLQSSSLLAARLAKRVVGDPKIADAAFTAAIVHDVGKIILALGLPERFLEVLRSAKQSSRAFHVVEQELFGTTHAKVGAYLLGVWGLPFPIVEAVAYHHDPAALVSEADPQLLAALHVADALVDRSGDGHEACVGDEGLDMAFLERLGLLGELPRWRAMAEEDARSVAP